MISSLLLLAVMGWSPGEAPISATDWAVVENPAAGIRDAVVLLDTTDFSEKVIERYRRVRILSENGKAAAEFYDESGTAYELKGRVVLPDGSEIRFGQKDLVETLSMRSQRHKETTRLLVPPGLTDDCIVETSWTLPATNGLPSANRTYFDFVAEPWFVGTKSYTFHELRGGSYVHQIWTKADEGHFAFEKTNTRKKVTYREIAAAEDQPFGNPFRHEQAHYVYAFHYYFYLDLSPDKFWDDFAQKIVRNRLTYLDFSPGSDWDDWVRELRASLPADPVAAMTLVQSQFRKRFALTSLLSPEQAPRVTRTIQPSDLPSRLLGATWRRGYGNASELSQLFFRLVQALDLPVSLVYPSRLDALPFDPRTLDANCFDLNKPLYAVYVKDQPVIFAPVWYEYRPGYFPSSYLEMPALRIDPRTWKTQFITMPGIAAESNRLVSQYKSQLHPNGTLTIQFKRQGTGAFLANVMRHYFPLPAPERTTHLKERWSDQHTTVEAAAVEGADDLMGLVTETLAATRTVARDDTTRLVIEPFLHGMMPLETPAVWPEHREQDLFAPYAFQTIDLNTLTLPEGWRLIGDNTWEHTNEVGSVKYSCVQKGNMLTVRRDVTLRHCRYPRSQLEPFKAFLTWMEEAYAQSLTLDLAGDAP